MAYSPERQTPQFAYTLEGRAAYAYGWLQKAVQWEGEASRTFGLSADQRALLRSNARAARSHARQWRDMGRQLRKAG